MQNIIKNIDTTLINENDSLNKLTLMLQLAWELSNHDIEGMHKLATKSQELAIEVSDKSSYAESKLLIAQYKVSKGLYLEALDIATDAYQIFINLVDKVGQVKSYYILSLIYGHLEKTGEPLISNFIDLKEVQAKKNSDIYKLKNVELKQKSMEIEQKARELEDSFKNIEIISTIGQKITATLDIELVLNIIYENIIHLMDANIFGISLYDEKTGVIDYKMYVENSERHQLFQTSIQAEDIYATQCIRTKKTIIFNDLVPDSLSAIPSLITETYKKLPRSLIYSPLILSNKVIGSITVQSYKANAYTPRNLETIKALASYIAIALNNSQKSELLQIAIKELELASITDHLTELFNRRYIIEKIKEECDKFQRNSRKFSLIISDIDLFKNVNDSFGHDCGDYVLKSLSKLLKSQLRKPDYLARWGGEEFLILLPETNCEKSFEIAERLRKIIQEKVFIYNNAKFSITMTFGITEYNGEKRIEDTIKKADDALYNGKNKGRNCVKIQT